MIEFDPEVTVAAAAAAGWPACGIWFDPATWTPQRTAEVRRVLDGEGIVALDIEPIIVGPDGDPADALVEVGAELGARFVLFTSRSGDMAHVTSRFAHACDRAAESGMTVVCEFLPMLPLSSIEIAVQIVRDADRPNGAVLIDNLHLRTSGELPSVIGRYDRELFPYVQIADAPLIAPVGAAERYDEALNGRTWPGEGELPVAEVLAAIPNVPISYEVRSKWMRDTFPDPVDRARHGWSAIAPLRSSNL